MLLFLLACDGPAPETTEAPTPPAEAPTPAEVAPTPTEVAPTPEASQMAEVFSEAQRTAIAEQAAAFEGISTASEFATTFRAHKALASDLSVVLQDRYDMVMDSDQFGNMDISWLKPHLPTMKEGYFAEGTAIRLLLMPKPWAERAAATPEPEDDAFLAFMALAYHNPGASGWSLWNVRNWDYGGCSGLGTGVYASTLQAADKALASGDRFKPEINEVRQRLMNDLLTEESTFGWCNPQTMEATPTEDLSAEAQRILETVKLSDEEKAKIQARISANFALDVISG
jgi:hypothetical protein